MSDWESVKARLEEDALELDGCVVSLNKQAATNLAADIRSALQRDEVREASAKILVKQRDEAETEVERLRDILRDFDWDETGTPTGWPIRERIDAALRREGEK